MNIKIFTGQKNVSMMLYSLNIEKKCYKERIENSENKTKMAWQLVKEIKGNSKNQGNFCLEGDPQVLSDEINQFMANAAAEAVKKIKPVKNFQINIEQNNHCMFLIPVSEKEIGHIINSLKNKHSSGYDEISTSLIKFVSSEICLPLSFIVNTSFRQGKFPQKSKTSNCQATT
uniref:Uncharacterized protein LOC114336129 isoform X1 n=1 Tax=Diabrotica virgifera virgifera TaxID=50390 RepID=A0A6P7G0C1_DIAVI